MRKEGPSGLAREAASIREATVEDAERLSAFAARTFRETFATDNTPEDMAAYLGATFTPQHQRRELEDLGTRVFLVEQGRDLMAYAQIATHEAPDCVGSRAAVELARFYVDAPWHGHGIASMLMRRVLDAAGSLGARVLWLGVWERNARAIGFYRKMGFEDVGSQAFILGHDVQTDRVMRRAIDGHDTCADR